VYQVENNGHFGLGYDAYTHFTSPIRRYPDLLIHRAIRSVIRSEQPSVHVQRVDGARNIPREQIYPYDVQAMIMLGEHSSLAERRADEATRDVVSWLKCEYLSDHVGSIYPGVISAVTGFGVFVELKDIYVDGLVHITALPQDYYRFDAARHRLVGERTRQVFGLGDELTVKVVRVSLDERKIDFEMESFNSSRRAGKLPAAAGKDNKSGKSTRGKSRGERNKKAAGSSQPPRASGKPMSKPRKRKVQDGAQTHAQKVRDPAQNQSVRSPQKTAAPAGKSFIAKATAGFKKTLARFKKKP